MTADSWNRLNDVVFENYKYAVDIEYDLLNLSKAFKLTGNTIVANELTRLANDVMVNAKAVRDAHSVNLADIVKRSDESSKIMLEAVIAGVTMSNKSPRSKPSETAKPKPDAPIVKS